MATAHGGRYAVHSAAGRGSVFWIEFPAVPTGVDLDSPVRTRG
ncbi:hypothetical protein [Sporichthya sp.]